MLDITGMDKIDVKIYSRKLNVEEACLSNHCLVDEGYLGMEGNQNNFT